MKEFDIKRILVPVDFSDNSIDAYHTALAMAQQHNAQVTLLYVFDIDNNLYPESPVNNRYRYPGDIIRSLEQLAKTAREEFSVSCNISYLNGPVTTSILQTSFDTDADIIVMGKNGNAGHRPLYAGSHAYDVIKKSHCPVLIIPGGKASQSFRNVLFPVRPMINMIEKYNMVKPVLSDKTGSLHLMGMRDPAEPNELHVISRLMNLLKQSADDDGLPARISYYFADNKFAKHVLETAASGTETHDLLMITAELDEPVRDFYVGAYAQQIIHETTIPLLVIRSPDVKLTSERLIRVLDAEMPVF